MIVVAERPPARVHAGDALALDVHVISDLRQPIDPVEVRAVARWNGGDHGWRWQGAVEADSCVRVGTISMVVPAAPGELVFDLDLVGAGDVVASNRYSTIIAS